MEAQHVHGNYFNTVIPILQLFSKGVTVRNCICPVKKNNNKGSSWTQILSILEMGAHVKKSLTCNVSLRGIKSISVHSLGRTIDTRV